MIPLLLALLFAPAWRMAQPGYVYQFPRDHFSHPGYQTEWWYYTGNVQTRAGHHYGFELVFFRQGQQREATNPSAWRVDDLYLAHFAVTDIDSSKFSYFERTNRAGPGIAGASLTDARIWNGNWQSAWDLATGAQTLSAVENGIRLELHLAPRTPPVINGENGVSQKSDTPGHASHYVSFPLLAAEGKLNGAAVSGTAWMDHEWFTNLLEVSAEGWDWFSVQLENHTELMLSEMRYKSGARPPYLAGTYIDAAGRASPLRRGEIQMQAVEWWRSPRTGASYPIRWKLSAPSRGIALECAAAVSNQELVFPKGTTYWEGAVRYTGSQAGIGYMELTGYAGPVRM